MPVIVWIFGSLMVAAIAAAFAIALRLGETQQTLDRVRNDLKIARSDLSMLNEKHNQEKADIQTMANARINELTEMVAKLSHSQPPKLKTRDFTINNLIWTATNSNIGLRMDDLPRCKEHDLLLLQDRNYYFCPETIKGNCQCKFPLLHLRPMKEFAESYIDKEFRQN